MASIGEACQFETSRFLTLLKEAARGITENYDLFHKFLVKTRDSFSEVYESLEKMREKFEGEYKECCNKLRKVIEEALQYFNEVQDSLDASKTQLGQINDMQQTESEPPSYSAMKELVTLLNKCISRVQEFQSEFSKRCDDAIAEADKTAVTCRGLAARAQTAKRTTQTVGVVATVAGATILGALTAGIGTALSLTTTALTGITGVAFTHVWASDFEEVKNGFFEMKNKLRALQQTSRELQVIVNDSQQIVKKLKPITDTIDRFSTADGEIHNLEGLQIERELKRAQDHASSLQEDMKAKRQQLKRKVAIEPEVCTAGKKSKQS